MSKSTPFYSVQFQKNGQSLNNFITSFTFEDSVSESDVLKIQLDGVENDLIDNPLLQEGSILQFNFGYIGGSRSGFRLARITDIDYNYQKTKSITIKAFDVGFILKKGTKTFTWKDVSIKGICEAIAKKNNLTLKITDLEGVENRIENNVQVAESDWDFLTETIQREGTGNLLIYCHDDQLIVKPRSTNKNSKITYDYNQGNNQDIISFKPKERDTRKDTASNKTEIKDAVDGENAVRTESSTLKTSNETKLGSNSVYYDANGNSSTKDDSSTQNKTEVKTEINHPVASQQEAVAKVTKIQSDASMKDITATLSVLGDPNLFSDDIITMSGVAAKHKGNYYIEKATHKISSSGYILTCDLNKNARDVAKIKGEEKLNKVNNTSGPSESKSQKEIKFVDYDGGSGKKIRER